MDKETQIRMLGIIEVGLGVMIRHLKDNDDPESDALLWLAETNKDLIIQVKRAMEKEQNSMDSTQWAKVNVNASND